MSREEAKGFTEKDLLRMSLQKMDILFDKIDGQGNRLTAIETHMVNGKTLIDSHEKDIKKLNGWMTGLKLVGSTVVAALGIHIGKNGGL